MSDSENDLLPSNVYSFQNENTMISAKGPSINGNMTNFSFRNNVLTSTMHMPRNFERQGYLEPSFNQRSMYYRREPSPASMYSGSGIRGRNCHQSYYGGGTSSQRSMYYGRSGSPMSMRSMDSNASVSAVDIAQAFKNVNFNKHDLRMIKDAYNKLMKRRIRKKIEKRRNMRLYLKGYRRKSGYDSGEQGSDSSISSDECKSTSSAMFKDNMSCRSTRTELSDFRRTIMDSTMYKDCTDNLKQNVFKNLLSMPSASFVSRDRFHAPAGHNQTALPQTEFAVPNAVHKQPFTQKDRFKTGYLLPSQRFNKSVASMPFHERDPRLQSRQNALNAQKQAENQLLKQNGHVSVETDSDQEAIFSEVTVREKTHIESVCDKSTEQRKRCLETEENIRDSVKKRPKLSSPVKTSKTANCVTKNTKTTSKENQRASCKNKKATTGDENEKIQNDLPIACGKQSDDFEFLKPQFPVRKSGPAKPKEKLISKSAQPLIDEIVPQSIPTTNNEPDPGTDNQKNQTEEIPDTTQNSNTSDLSMRPSFMKRKLFTQKPDLQEKKNLSSDNLNSPQTNVYSAIQKDKHKARKLVANQSCLSRDIAADGNNLLDLIHKIVPPDRMNMTNVTNKTSISTNLSSKNPANDDDKWDITSIISTCNNDDCSETYTDEEIFGGDNTQKKTSTANKTMDNINKPKVNNTKSNNVNKSNDNKKHTTVNNPIVKSDCRILLEKLPQNKLVLKQTAAVCNTNVPQENDNNKKSIYNCVKSFWDTDFESDMESPAPKRATYRCEEVKENQNKTVAVEKTRIPENKKIVNLSLASVSESIKSKTMPTNNLGIFKKFNISKTLSIKSYLTPKPVKSKSKIGNKNQKDDEVPNAETRARTGSCNNPAKQCKKQIVIEIGKVDQELEKIKVSKDPITIKMVDTVKKPDVKKSKLKNGNGLMNSTKKQTNTKTKVDMEAEKTEAKRTRKTRSDVLNATAQPVPTKSKINAKTTKETNKTVANKSIAGRTVRTPKRIACCGEPDDHDNSAKSSETKSKRNNSKKPKLVDTSGAKDKKAENINKSVSVTNQSLKVKEIVARKPRTRVDSKKVEQVVPAKVKNLEVPQMNRTLRSRRIDLSSSINSSTENVTLQIRSLRTRRVDLSNSLKNSSLDETIKKAPRSNAVSKKVATKPNQAEVLKKPRTVK